MVLPPHVVRQARAETELGQEIKPAHARLLIGPKRSLKGIPWINSGQVFGTAASLESPGEPRAGLDMRPLRGRRRAGGGADFGSCQQTHGLPERYALLFRQALDRLKFVEGRS
jgi:hypothetical protein